MNQGIFITLEGIEGVGKSTHASFIADQLEKRGRKIILTREPGGTETGESIREILLSNKNKHKVSDDLELLLMFAARAQHLQEIIVPALTENKVVICDRFTDASYAYQGGGRGMPVERIRALEHWVQKDLRPDLTLLLDVCVETGLNRAGSRSEADRFESEAIHFFEKVRKAYLDIARAEQERVSIIDASGTIEEVQHEILKVLQDKRIC